MSPEYSISPVGWFFVFVIGTPIIILLWVLVAGMIVSVISDLKGSR